MLTELLRVSRVAISCCFLLGSVGCDEEFKDAVSADVADAFGSVTSSIVTAAVSAVLGL